MKVRGKVYYYANGAWIPLWSDVGGSGGGGGGTQHIQPIIAAADPSPGFPGGAPAIYPKGSLASGGSSSSYLVFILGDPNERWDTLYAPYPETSWYDANTKEGFAAGGSSSPHLTTESSE